MKLEIFTADPLNILSSTKPVVEKAVSVFINESRLEKAASKTKKELEKGATSTEAAFASTGNLQDDIQLIFLEDVLNFCFWPDKGEPKWSIEWPKGHTTSGGWYTLKAAFERALTQQKPILDTDYLATISLSDVREIFSGVKNTQIPLLNKRCEFLQEAGKFLLEKYNGQFANVVKELDFDAIKIAYFLSENISAFKDVCMLEGQEIYFLKKAQICANDLSYLSQIYPDFKIKNIKQLTAFADYKIPQILEMFGVIEYTPELKTKISNHELIPKESREEVEIRAVTIWAVELIRQKMPQYTAGQIDNILWDLSQIVRKESSPHHKTRTVFY